MSFDLLFHFTPLLGTFGITEIPALIALYSGIASAAAGGYSAYASSQAQKTQAEQTQMNAEAQRDALVTERARKAQEAAENSRRLALQERRERASVLAEQGASGVMTTTGTPLAIMADTLAFQQERRADIVNRARLDQWQLGAEGQALMQEAGSHARSLRSQAGASLVSGILGAAQSGLSTYDRLAPARKTTLPATTPGTVG
ncbi:hypothetical protein WJU23_14475 [Prosthecobacter sp. SYSU 5D2]|uniref:virion core protein, T7 gp14 family n=1 Tax=Prosthecobacter sp. SYSU 5D2 TaxID=3134134 RepID=UPI0031FF3544